MLKIKIKSTETDHMIHCVFNQVFGSFFFSSRICSKEEILGITGEFGKIIDAVNSGV